MTDRDIMDKLIMDCFTHGVILDNTDVFMSVGKYSMRKVTGSLSRLRDSGRLSFKKSGRSFVYWVDVINIIKPSTLTPLDFGAIADYEPSKPYVFVDNPVIGSDVSYSAWGHIIQSIKKCPLGQFLSGFIIVFGPWLAMAFMIVN